MSLDFDALRKKLSTLKGQNNRSTSTWKPTEGNSIIRIVPWKDNADNPFIELYFHYMGRKTQLSPLSVNKADPIAEFADKLRSTGDKEDWMHAKDFSPRLRTYVPIIVRGEEELGVRFYGFGKTVYEELVGVMLDEDWGDISDPKTGRDIALEYIPVEKNDTNFPKTLIRVKPNTSPLSDDKDVVEKFLTEQPDIHEVFPCPEYDELASFLKRFLNPDADESVTTADKSPSTKSEDTEDETSEKDEKSSDSTDDVADEFEALFNED